MTPLVTSTLSPFGEVTNARRVYAGALFDLYAVDLNDREVCLKTPSPKAGTAVAWRCERSAFIGSEAFISGSNGAMAVGDGAAEIDEAFHVASAMLVVEAQVLEWAGPAWNHAALGLGCWDGTLPPWEREQLPVARRFAPTLVMPRHDAEPLAALPPEERRRLVPRMLPALWDALCRCYHGDLSESNLLVARDRSRFHLVDPGVLLSSSAAWGDPRTSRRATTLAHFTTTPANYPLLFPFEDVRLFGADPTLDLAGCLDRVWSCGYADEPGFTIVSTSNWEPAAPPRARPLPSDLLAMGIILVRALAGVGLFLDSELGLDRPAWEGQLPSAAGPTFQMNPVLEAFARAKSAIEAGYVERRLGQLGLSDVERRLAEALVSLSVASREELAALVAGLG